MAERKKALVEAGYDALGERYLAWSREIVGDPRDRFVMQLLNRLPVGSRVLDVGCGTGVPSTRQLAERFEVTAADISEQQLRLARANVPGAKFIRGDLSDLEFEDGTFAGVSALYVMSHVPRENHEGLFKKFARWLRPAGFFVASLGATGQRDWTGEWLGVPMFFSSHDADMNRRLLHEAGLQPVLDEVITNARARTRRRVSLGAGQQRSFLTK